MPDKKKAPKRRKFEDGLTWVMNNLTKEELKDMDKRNINAEDLFGDLQRLLELGWTVSLKWDFVEGCVLCTCTQPYIGLANEGLAFSGRSPDVLDTLIICHYKFYVKAGGNLGDFDHDEENLRG